eukprot:TRINITY_DN3363_c0_g2_i1.p2 TRINITY_DN3363_c0_g2~~TRINITY_DN3363_c0_g2_i1.p2  ORF type:complete len:109 (+),score=17.52 TRINITY_DN3363_c0_g2_i1:102-428(+)
MAIAIQRLKEERKNWRKDRPFGFYARPVTDDNGELNLLEWEAVIPGKDGTIWEGGEYKLNLAFTKDYPSKPPKYAKNKGKNLPPFRVRKSTGVRQRLTESRSNKVPRG